MDRLASEGAFFRNAFLTTPICAASRASIFSGLYERTHKYTFQTGPIRDEYMQYSYPRVLRDAGYYTGFYGKFGVNYNHPDRLFDVYEDYDRDNRLSEYSAAQEFRTGTFTGNVSTGNAFHIERIKPVKLEKTGAESYFADFGKDAFGTLELDYYSPKSDTLIIRLGEKLLGESVDRSPGAPKRPSTKRCTIKTVGFITMELVPSTVLYMPICCHLLLISFLKNTANRW